MMGRERWDPLHNWGGGYITFTIEEIIMIEENIPGQLALSLTRAHLNTDFV